jgi:hypothetical protein
MASYSLGGTPPMAVWIRWALYQSTYSAGYELDIGEGLPQPRGLISSVLYRRLSRPYGT